MKLLGWERVCTTAVLILALVGSVNADALHDGVTAYKRNDYMEAMRILRPIAEQGVSGAQLSLGFMYANGLGVTQNYTQAAKWYRKAAEQGYAPAQNNLGVMYGLGRGVPQNYVEAHKWFNLAAASGLSMAAEVRNSLAKYMTPEQIAEAQKLASEWQPKK